MASKLEERINKIDNITSVEKYVEMIENDDIFGIAFENKIEPIKHIMLYIIARESISIGKLLLKNFEDDYREYCKLAIVVMKHHLECFRYISEAEYYFSSFNDFDSIIDFVEKNNIAYYTETETDNGVVSNYELNIKFGNFTVVIGKNNKEKCNDSYIHCVLFAFYDVLLDAVKSESSKAKNNLHISYGESL